MARSVVQPAPAGVAALASDELSAEEQSQLDQMREDDAGEATPEPAAEPAAEPRETGEASAEPAADGRPRMVPHAAMHEERVRRQATEKELADERKARQTLEERTNLLLQRIQPAAQPAQQTPAQPEIPDVATDPVGHIVGRMNQQQAVLEQLAQALVTAGQQNQAAQVQASVQQRAAALESDFRAANPEYDAAANYLTDMRNKELVELGWTDPVERRIQIAREALEVADRALKESRNPAEVIMGLAKIRGFAPVAAAEGAANGVAAPAAAAPNAGQRIANAAAGQRQAGTSLSNARGAAPAPITAERLISMNDSEFAEFVANASPAQMRAAMGE